MGDRCYITVEYATKDREKILATLDWGVSEDETEDGKTSSTSWTEVNWAGVDDLIKLARAGLLFIASNGSGGEYGEGKQFPLPDKTLDEVETVNGVVCVHMGEDGEMSPIDVATGKAACLRMLDIRKEWEE